MAFSAWTVDIALAALASVALAACTPAVPGSADANGIDARYGIPPGSVPAYLLRPDGLMTNGLLPAQPYDSGG